MTQLARARRASVLLREVPDVRLVHEVYVIGYAMHPHPVNRDPARVEVPQLLDLRLVVTHGQVTTHAETDRRDRSRGALGHVPVTEGAIEAEVLHVSRMGERYRLVGTVVYAKSIKRQSEPCRDDERRDSDNYDETDDTAEAERAEQDEPTPRRPSWCLKVPWQQVRLPYLCTGGGLPP